MSDEELSTLTIRLTQERRDKFARIGSDRFFAWLDSEDAPAMDAQTYNARAIPRLAAIDALSAKIDFSSHSWRYTPEGERWQRLMAQQGADEAAAGL